MSDSAVQRALALNKEGHYRYAKRQQAKREQSRIPKWERKEDREDIMAKAIHAIRVANGTSHAPKLSRQSESAKAMREFMTGNKGGTITWTPVGAKIKSSGRGACRGQSRNEELTRGAINSVNVDNMTATALRDSSGDIRTIAEVDHTDEKDRGY